ncbi:MAG: hypothetical protein NTX90_01915 [Alphaproteobacteria bacterium]|nr:hypothetical protein [Alphaproteobacteria bacterium]
MAKARVAFALFLLALPGLALAQPSREALEEARRATATSRAASEAAAREAEAAAAEESGLARQRVAMAARVQDGGSSSGKGFCRSGQPRRCPGAHDAGHAAPRNLANGNAARPARPAG